MLVIRSRHVLVYNNVLFTHALYFRNKVLFKLNRHFPSPPSAPLLPLRRLHCLYNVYHDGISVLGTDRSQKEPHQENMGDEEEFEIHIQSQQSWQLLTCGQRRFPARAEHRESAFLASFLRFPGVAVSIRLHNMHCLSCDLAQKNENVDRRWTDGRQRHWYTHLLLTCEPLAAVS